MFASGCGISINIRTMQGVLSTLNRSLLRALSTFGQQLAKPFQGKQASRARC
jgi:hypothetical protein